MTEVQVSKDVSRIVVTFPYNPLLIEKIKMVKGHRWHPTEKYWSFPNMEGMVEKIIQIFAGEKVHVNPSLQKQPSLREKHPEKNFLGHDFEDLRKELTFRKYNSKTTEIYTHVSSKDFIRILYASGVKKSIGSDPSDRRR
ncbi:MAG: hypothetical protein J7L53_06910 [Deltaproteobacteria bacterium]|nr:hypothetical protein [Deltaproteobacteria bacterium]